MLLPIIMQTAALSELIPDGATGRQTGKLQLLISQRFLLTPGADDTQLNFAWYSEKGDSAATPIVHFGTDKDNLETFEGTSGDVDQNLTGDQAYEYNHVTVTGLEPNTTYYYTVEKNGQQTDVCEYTTQRHRLRKNPLCR